MEGLHRERNGEIVGDVAGVDDWDTPTHRSICVSQSTVPQHLRSPANTVAERARYWSTTSNRCGLSARITAVRVYARQRANSTQTATPSCTDAVQILEVTPRDVDYCATNRDHPA